MTFFRQFLGAIIFLLFYFWKLALVAFASLAALVFLFGPLWLRCVTGALSLAISLAALHALHRRMKEKSHERMLERHGVKHQATIVRCVSERNQTDDEHEDFELEYEFTYNGKTVRGDLAITLNSDHIEYASEGMLYGVAKLNFSMQDVRGALAKGAMLDIIVFPDDPAIHSVLRPQIIIEAAAIR